MKFTGIFDLSAVFERNSSRGRRRSYSSDEAKTFDDSRPKSKYSPEELRKAAEEIRRREEAEKREQTKKEAARAYIKNQESDKAEKESQKGWATEEQKRIASFKRMMQFKKAPSQRD